METVVRIHAALANTVWIFFLALSLRGYYRAIRQMGVDSSFLGALIIAEGLYLLQGVLGVALWVGGNSVNVSRMTMHVLYGVFAVVFLPFLFTYQRGDDSNRAQWVYALGLLFLFGIALRAGYTGT